MKENLWSKTLLGVYNYLETVADAIDKITLKTALGSFYFSKQTYEKNNVLTISNRIIDLSQRKITLINLKVLVEDILFSLPKKDSLILIARYINRQKISDIAEKISLCRRSIFRKLKSAEEKFLYELNKRGYDSFRLNNTLKDEHWILNYYNRLKKSESDFVIQENLEKVVAL